MSCDLEGVLLEKSSGYNNMYNRANEVKRFFTLIDEIQVTGSSIPDKEPNLSLLGPVKRLVVLPVPLIQSN